MKRTGWTDAIMIVMFAAYAFATCGCGDNAEPLAMPDACASFTHARSCDSLGCNQSLAVSRFCASSNGEDCNCNLGTKEAPEVVACHPSCSAWCEGALSCDGDVCTCTREGEPLRCTEDRP